MSTSRLEKFIYAICSMEVSDLPAPLSRIEILWNCLITGETPDFEPQSRNEQYLMAMLGLYELDQLPTPLSRGEKLLYKIAMGETDLSDVPGYLSRYEELLKYLIENGGVGDFEYILQTLNQRLNTLYSTKERPVKSAILKGVTKYKNIDGQFYEDFNIFASCKKLINQNLSSDGELVQSSIRSVVDYIAINDVSVVKINGLTIKNLTFYDESKNKITTITVNTSLEYTLDIPEGAKYFRFSYDSTLSLESASITLTTVELASVKTPVLTTTGKNLFDGEIEEGVIDANTGEPQTYDGRSRSKNFIRVPKNTDLYIKVENGGSTSWTTIYGYDENKKYLGCIINSSGVNKTFNTGDASYIKWKNNTPMDTLGNIQIEQGSTATSYEPYKSNILTVNEDVTLRGIGNVKDTLDLATGKVTQRVGEYVITGEESWGNTSSADGYFAMVFNDNKNLNRREKGKIQCNKLKVLNNATMSDEYIYGGIGVYMSFSRTRVADRTAFINHLKGEFANGTPYVIQYELATPVVKTVDLTTVDQDGQPTKLKTFNDVTYVEMNSENIIPSVDVEIATKISETLATIEPQHHDISETQNKLGQTIDEQTENTDAAMLATTEIYEQTL